MNKYSGLLGASALCYTCGWEADGRNAVGLAAQHAERHQHEVSAEQVISVSWRHS